MLLMKNSVDRCERESRDGKQRDRLVEKKGRYTNRG